MHELSICQALLAQVAEISAERGGGAVLRIVIEIGPLSGVEPKLLATAFDAARTGGCAAGAALSIETPPVRVSCISCRAGSVVSPNRLVCGVCGGYRTRVVEGAELRLRRVELRETRQGSSAAHELSTAD